MTLLLSTVAGAASPLPPAAEADRIFRQQEERQRALEQERLRPAPSESMQTPTLELSPVDPDAPCVNVRELIILGNTLLPQHFIDSLKAEYEGKCLTLEAINNITKTVTNAYADRGYITSRAFIGPQDLQSGALFITVVEGTIESFEPGPSSGIEPRQLGTVFPFLTGKVLNLRDIEQGLDQMNRLPSMNTTMRIEPGEAFGASVVIIDNEPQKSWRASAATDNHGQRNTGRHQYTLTFEKDNYLGCFDQFLLTWNSDLHSMFRGMNSRANGNSHGFGIYETIPIGYWTFGFSYNAFAYDNKVYGLADEYTSSGESHTFRLSADRVMYRDADGKTSAGVSLTVHNVDSYFEGVYLDASSYFLTSLGFSLSHSRRLLGGSLSAQVEQRMGVPIFGAEKERAGREVDRNTPRREYQKTVFSVNWYRPFAVAEQTFSWSSNFSAQVAPRTLYGSERFYLGSLYTVRGFEGSPLGGDQGMLLRNELAWNVPPVLDWLTAITGPVQAYAGYDVGSISKDKHDPFERGTLQGMALGLRSYGDMSFDVTYAVALASPDFVERKGSILSASVRYTF